MVKMKQLYFLHIPKTAGQFITEAIRLALEKNNINDYFIYNGAFVVVLWHVVQDTCRKKVVSPLVYLSRFYAMF